MHRQKLKEFPLRSTRRPRLTASVPHSTESSDHSSWTGQRKVYGNEDVELSLSTNNLIFCVGTSKTSTKFISCMDSPTFSCCNKTSETARGTRKRRLFLPGFRRLRRARLFPWAPLQPPRIKWQQEEGVQGSAPRQEAGAGPGSPRCCLTSQAVRANPLPRVDFSARAQLCCVPQHAVASLGLRLALLPVLNYMHLFLAACLNSP